MDGPAGKSSLALYRRQMISDKRLARIVWLLSGLCDEVSELLKEAKQPPMQTFTPREWATYPEVLPGRKYPGDEISNPNDLPPVIVLDS